MIFLVLSLRSHSFHPHHHLISGYNNIFISPFMCEFMWKVTLIVYHHDDISLALFFLQSAHSLVAYVCGRFAAWMQFTSWLGKTTHTHTQTKISFRNTLDSECYTRGLDSLFSSSQNTLCYMHQTKRRSNMKWENEKKGVDYVIKFISCYFTANFKKKHIQQVFLYNFYDDTNWLFFMQKEKISSAFITKPLKLMGTFLCWDTCTFVRRIVFLVNGLGLCWVFGNE